MLHESQNRVLPDDPETLAAMARMESNSSETTQRDRDLVTVFIARNLWPPSVLDEHIRQVHAEQCAKCPLRLAAAAPQPAATGGILSGRIDINVLVRGVLAIIITLIVIIAHALGAKIPFLD